MSDILAAFSGRRRRRNSAIHLAAYSPAMLFPAALLLIAAHKPPPPAGDLVLDMADPVILVQIGDATLRLRVDLDQQDSIELNPEAATRLPLAWEDGMEMDVGRVRLPSRIARATVRIDSREFPTQVSEHGRDCCQGADGAIGPNLLPFATVLWRRTEAPASNGSRSFVLTDSAMTGLSAPAGIGKLRLRFALTQAGTVGTAAAGAILSQDHGGHWKGEPGRVTLAFGVSRPARTIAFERPVTLAGFNFETLLVRVSDFAGDQQLPSDPVDPGDVVVTRHLERQQAWPAITIGSDRLARCSELTYTALPRTLTLRCAFDPS